MKIVFDESYGTLSYALRAAIRKYNVSPADYSNIAFVFMGNEEEYSYKVMTEFIKQESGRGYYVAPSGDQWPYACLSAALKVDKRVSGSRAKV